MMGVNGMRRTCFGLMDAANVQPIPLEWRVEVPLSVHRGQSAVYSQESGVTRDARKLLLARVGFANAAPFPFILIKFARMMPAQAVLARIIPRN